MNSRLLCACLLIAFSGLSAKESKDSHQKVMLKDLDAIRNSFSVKYAPAEWKRSLFGWDIDQAFDKARKQVVKQNPRSVKAFQQILKSVFFSAKDYHARVIFYSTEKAYFPLALKGTLGRYFIAPWNGAGLESEDTNESMEDLQKIQSFLDLDSWVGAEVLEMDGMPIHYAIEKIIDEDLGGDRTPAGYSIAEKHVFLRRGEFGQSVPSGAFELLVRHKGEKKETSYFLPWFYTKEQIKDQVGYKRKYKHKKAVDVLKSQTSAVEILNQDYSVAFVADLVARDQFFKMKRQGVCDWERETTDHSEEKADDRKKSFLPPLGEIIWETDPEKGLYAYLYENSAGQRIGYLCLPTFMQDEDDSMEIVTVMQKFNEESDALIIDITDNHGGRLFFMYSILAMLTDKPLKTLVTEQIINQEDVYSSIQLAKLCVDPVLSELILPGILSGYPMNHEVRMDMLRYANQIIWSWNSGRKMTPRLPGELSCVLPHPDVQYTKPVLVLVNEMDFSCGDMFPAILQDNQRAVVFGQTTGGAGGCVRRYEHVSQMGVAGFSLTNSLVYRSTGEPIENQGITPNIPYSITVRDLQENYIDYIQAVNGVIEQMAPLPPPPEAPSTTLISLEESPRDVERGASG